MSRTKRRLGKDVNSKIEKNYTYTDKYEKCITGKGVSQFTGRTYDVWKDIPIKQKRLPYKEYKAGWWKFHGDHYHPIHTKLYRDDWGSVRTKNRNNLIHHLSEDTDCFFWEDVNTQDWD